ncbi:MAG TPA: radical SAM protein [bacterium]|nr:radical SAM protein [bacterium]
MNKIISKFFQELSYQTGQHFIQPTFLSLIITMKCNFRCQSCTIWQKEANAELEEKDWLNIINKLNHELPAKTFVEINGGEPLIRKNLVLKIIRELKKHFETVTLNTNGLLINEEMVEKLKNAGIDNIKLSFYSLSPETHNYLRGYSLAYEQAKKAIEIINQKQVELEIGLLITAQNINEAPALIKFLQTLPKTKIILQPLDEKIESEESKFMADNKLPTDLWPNEKEVNNFFSWLMTNRKNIKNSLVNIKALQEYYLKPSSVLKFRCFAGQRNLVIYPNGDTSFCFKMRPIGNVVQQELKKILKNASRERKVLKKCKKYCRIVGCNFSQGINEFISDKLTKKYDF